MLQGLLVTLAVAAATPSPIQAAPAADTIPLASSLARAAAASAPGAIAEAPRPEAEAQDVGDWYARRLAVHRYSAWVTAAAFPIQLYTGTQLLDQTAALAEGREDPAPGWAAGAHTVMVGVLGTTFTVNTVTGAWNWWEDRRTPEGRGWRTAHALVMLAADAAIVGTAVLGRGVAGVDDARTHRAVAFTAAGLATVGHLMMLRPFRRD